MSLTFDLILGLFLDLQCIFNYKQRFYARLTLHIANPKTLRLSLWSFITCNWFSSPNDISPLALLRSCPHNMVLISQSNYSSLLSSPCGLQSVKQRHVCSCSLEKGYETPVSDNNSFLVCAALTLSNSFHPFGFLQSSTWAFNCLTWYLCHTFAILAFFGSCNAFYLNRLEWLFLPCSPPGNH